MHYYEVAPTKIIRSGSDSFTYSSELSLPIGSIVLIEIGKKQLTGVVIKKSNKPAYATKEVLSIITEQALPVPLVKLALWLSEYYVTPLAVTLRAILPSGIRKKRRITKSKQNIIKRDRTSILFNKDQSNVIQSVSESDNGTFLLQGVTGSGKTEVYIDLARKTIKDNRSVIILVPEISLTSQIISEFSNYFDDLLVTHSQMTESERHIVWLEALNSSNARVVIGPRSALFTPLSNVGLIVIDEAHEPGYKQEQSPKYSALRAATMLGRFHGAKVIFGSATPNIIDRYLAEQSVQPVLKMTEIARKNSIPPAVSLIDMTDRSNFSGHRFLSKQLIKLIENTLSDGKQVLIFHNRRGSATTTLCKDCGWTAQCLKCFLPLTLHTDKNELQCHICGYHSKIPTSCPLCHETDIVFKGIGTKLIESELKKLFPKANIARFDADNHNDETVNSRYSELYNGTIDIAIGTQVVAKGLDLPNLRAVGVIQADTGLALPDFNASERTFQLLAQVVGRVGRNEHQASVVVQSYQPHHPSVVYGLTQDYESFYKETIDQRRKAVFPPFTHLLKLTCLYKSESAAVKNTKKVADDLTSRLGNNIQILGPTPAFYERQFDNYRWQLIIKSSKREYLIKVLAFIPTEHWQFELDPTSLL